jgi:diguanylate cyclase (GGDEF)-like protein/PAS domain S-box-containing protein
VLQGGPGGVEPDLVNGEGGLTAARTRTDGGQSGHAGGHAGALSWSVTLLLYAVQALALMVVLVMRQFGLVANEPWWAYGLAIVGSSVLSKRLDRWIDAPRGSWRLHLRVLTHAVTVMSVIYLTGWGPALGVCFVYAALVDLQQSGSASWRAVLGWSWVCCATGQLLVLGGWAPSFLGGQSAQTLGFLGAFAFGIVIVMAGAIGEGKEHAEDLLARASEETARSEAMHRAVIENAAEGIFTIGPDGLVLSFNAAAEAIFGWTASEIVGRPGAMTLREDLHAALELYLETVQSIGHDAAPHGSWEVFGARRDGTHFPMVISTSAIVVEGFDPITCCIVRDLSEQKQLETQLSHQALHDALTGLPNRAMLVDRLDQALTRARRHHRMCGLLYVDLDRFKSVNDTLGHAAGDLLLVEAASRVQAAVRETDTVARLGGDEFVLLCEDLEGVHHATQVADRIIADLRASFRLGEDNANLTASIGIALSADGTETADALLAKADTAMYRAKDNGRNRYELFDAAMQQWVTTQITLETALRHAVARDELRLHYQSITSSETGVVRGFEALVRWERPGFGLVGPDEFIPTAEETGLIIDIGAWVLGEACAQAADWLRRWPDRRLGISVNVSSRQLVNREIVDLVTATLARTGLDPTVLTLELTESTLIDDTINTQAILRDLRDLGVNLSLDDFGTGYSSLTYLRAFPINIVKIDKSFVRTIGTEREDTAIVSAVLALAKNLEISVVAEGVETREQLAVLLQLQCPYLQGYLFSKPRPADEIAGLVNAEPSRLAE